MRTIVVGVGNPILGDDGVGIHVVRRLRELQGRQPDMDIEEAYTGGLNLLDMIIGYHRAILVDAVYLEDMEMGEVRTLDLDQLGSVHSTNPHDATLMEAVDISRKMGEERVPSVIKLVGIRIERVEEFSDRLSEGVKGAVDSAIEVINNMVRNQS